MMYDKDTIKFLEAAKNGGHLTTSMFDKIKLLLSNSRDFTLYDNVSRKNNKSVEEYFLFLKENDKNVDISEEIKQKMIEKDTVVLINIGSIDVFHYDVELALDEMIEKLKL